MPCAAMAHPTKYVEEQELQEVAEFNFKLAWLHNAGSGKDIGWPKRL
jgi:hypothetical protein